MESFIRLSNVRVNNLDISNLELELGKFHVFAGPSGSGKSSLAFDVLYAEADAQGRARGVSRIYRMTGNRSRVEGLPPFVIGIEQQLTSGGLIESIAWHTGLVECLAGERPDSPLCSRCGGKGYIRDIDPDKIIRDPTKRITAGALTPAVKNSIGLDLSGWKRFCEQEGIAQDIPWQKLPIKIQQRLLTEGTPFFKPVIPTLHDMLSTSPAGELAEELPYYTSCPRCPVCDGWGVTGVFSPDGRERTLGDVADRGKWFSRWTSLLDLQSVPLRAPLFRLSSAMARKLRFLAALQHLQPNSLVIFDEPAAGMTHAEAERMAAVLREVQKEGHTVIAVEHMPEVICAADMLTQFGPGSGYEGGRILYQGSPRQVDFRPCPPPARKACGKDRSKKWLQAHFSSWFGFPDFEVKIPLLRFICVCGPSGSGKTAYLEACYATCDKTPVAWQGRVALASRKGNDSVRRPHKVTPDPIGLHAGSTPATYTGLWDKVRDAFAASPDAKRHQLTKSHFSFNSPKGQCPECKGRGFLTRDDMHFEECPLCRGTRFKSTVLAAQFKNTNIAGVNAMTVRQASRLFAGEKNVNEHLLHFMNVALEYLVLGQPSNTLSGGENLRVKMVDLLSKRLGDRSLYILDNPCRGIGCEATTKLVDTFQTLAQKHTVLVAENTPVIARQADWLIILGAPQRRTGGALALNVRYAGRPSSCPPKLWQELASGTR